MSAANFIKLFREKRKGSFEDQSDYYDYRTWLTKNKTWFNKNRDDLEAMGLSKKVGFVVSESKANELGVGQAFQNLANNIRTNPEVGGPVLEVVDGVPVILFSDVPFKDGIERTLDKYFGSGTSTKYKDMGMIKGHIYGFMTGAVIGARDELHEFLSKSGESVAPIMSSDDADHALQFLDILINHLRKLDIESAELKNLSSPVFLKYEKSATNFLVELQSDRDNAESAKLVQKFAGQKKGSTGIRALIDPERVLTSGTPGKDTLLNIINILRESNQFSPRELLDFESSPPLKDLIVDEILHKGFGQKRQLPEKIVSPKIALPDKITSAYVNEQAKNRYRAELAKVKADALSNKQKILLNKNKTQALRNTQGQFQSIASLQTLINSLLPAQMKKNMGKGDSKVLLNYRTGRLAESPKVERISVSREGMISAFYSYMRNPYGTFSVGGAQGQPPSRDPKLLISKSIREIAATKVANRMRAILV